MNEILNKLYFDITEEDFENIKKYIFEKEQENQKLKEKLNILTINYKTLSADIGTVAEYMKLNEYAIIEEMIDRTVELVEKEKRINKAIEYIKKRRKDNVGSKLNFIEVDTVLEILKGSDSNE